MLPAILAVLGLTLLLTGLALLPIAARRKRAAMTPAERMAHDAAVAEDAKAW